MPFDWYEELNGQVSLEQGDLIPNCPVIIPPKTLAEGGDYSVIAKEYNVIVLTQSCDLVNGKTEMVTVCPYYTLTELLKNTADYQKLVASQDAAKLLKYLNGEAKNFAAGRRIGYHLLDKNPVCGIPEHLVVELRRAFSLDIDFVKGLIAERATRIRLLPPYREQLSQSFATLFMRVGLPSPIQDVE